VPGIIEKPARGRKPATTPMVTLRTEPRFSLNESAYDALGRPEGIVFLYDKNVRAIGFRAVLPDTGGVTGAYRIKQSKRSKYRWYTVYARQFIRFLGLRVEKAHTFKATMEGGDLAIWLDADIWPDSTGALASKT